MNMCVGSASDDPLESLSQEDVTPSVQAYDSGTTDVLQMQVTYLCQCRSCGSSSASSHCVNYIR